MPVSRLYVQRCGPLLMRQVCCAVWGLLAIRSSAMVLCLMGQGQGRGGMLDARVQR